MDIIQLQNENQVKTIFSTFCGWIAGLFTLAHVPLPLLGWIPHFHTSDFVLFIIGLIKAGTAGGASWLGVTAVQKTSKALTRKWKSFRLKK